MDFGDDRQSRRIDIWLDEARRGTLALDTNVVSGEVDLTALADGTVALDGGGLGRRISVYRLPEQDWSRRLAVDHVVTFPGGADLPVYVRVTQSDGHQATHRLTNLPAMLSRNALLADYSKRLHEVLRFDTGSHPRRTNDDQLIEPIVNKVVPRYSCGTSFTVFGVYLASGCTSNKNWALTVASTIGNKNIDEQSQ